MAEFHNVVASERGVDGWHGLGGVDDGLKDEIVDRVFVAVGFLGLIVDLFAKRHERGGIHFDVQIEMGNGGLGGQQAGCDDFAHAAELDCFVASFRHGKDGLGGRSGGWCGSGSGCLGLDGLRKCGGGGRLRR